MPTTERTRRRVAALLCPLALVVCALAAFPFAEIGMGDDWSYVRTAELLASTGHVVYNGWATTMLGWQLLPAAAVFRCLGASYLAARMTTLCVAAATAYGVERCLERCGVRGRNAVLVTIVLVTSPLFLPLSVSFMSDMYGQFAIVVCWYCCLRALRANGTRGLWWIAAATLTNAVGGTARQIAWLGLLVMVPCTLWLLRRNRVVLGGGAAFGVAGVGIMVAALRWFHAAPFAVPETFAGAQLSWVAVGTALVNLLRLALELGLLLLPLLIAFLPALLRERRLRIFTGVLGAGLFCAALVLQRQHLHLGRFLVPTLLDGGNFVGVQGMYTAVPEFGSRPTLLSVPLQVVLTVLVLASLAAVFVTLRLRRSAGNLHAVIPSLAWKEVLMVTAPFCGAYLLLLTPRAAFFHPYDRYGLPLLVMAVAIMTRLYQERLQPDLPWSVACVGVLVALYSVATMHDAFATYRGTETAVRELADRGVPSTAVDAGWEYSGWTQIMQGRFVHDPRLQLREAPQPVASDTRVCKFELRNLFPVVHPLYALGFQPDLCGGRTALPAVAFRTWLPWREQRIFILRDAPEPQ